MKVIEVQFDKLAYESYCKLQQCVADNKKTKKKPTYEQLLSSINTAIRNLKVNPYVGDLIPRKYLTKDVVAVYGANKTVNLS